MPYTPLIIPESLLGRSKKKEVEEEARNRISLAFHLKIERKIKSVRSARNSATRAMRIARKISSSAPHISPDLLRFLPSFRKNVPPPPPVNSIPPALRYIFIIYRLPAGGVLATGFSQSVAGGHLRTGGHALRASRMKLLLCQHTLLSLAFGFPGITENTMALF